MKAYKLPDYFVPDNQNSQENTYNLLKSFEELSEHEVNGLKF